VPNLRRGQSYPAETLLALCERLAAHWERQLAAERGGGAAPHAGGAGARRGCLLI
jgi:hypothetical protein